MKFLPFNILKYQLYIYQLEEYEVKRFLRSLLKKGIVAPRNLRKKVVWTAKAKIIAMLATLLKVIFSALITYLVLGFEQEYLLESFVLLVAIYYIFSFLSFVFLIQASDLILPIELYFKNRIITQAKTKFNRLKKLKVVAITGSYGKTTMKEVVSTILSEKFKVVKTEGNNNTPIGVARTILSKLNEDTEIFVVEMGEYVKGDVKNLCQLTPPDIAIITGINEAHLERYGSMENAISTKFEIIENAKENALFVLNADDELVLENYAKYINDNGKAYFYSSQFENSKAFITPENIKFDINGKGYTFEIKSKEIDLGEVKTPVIGEYIIGNIIGASIIAHKLGVNEAQIRMGITKIKPVEHRLEPKFLRDNIIVIDDTYNGNSHGIKQGLKLLRKFEGKRKVYVTPGLVETGSRAMEIHKEIGEQIAEVADLVILLKNSVTPYISKSLADKGFKEGDIIWYDDAKTMYRELYKHLSPNDVVLMQNDWSDNYS